MQDKKLFIKIWFVVMGFLVSFGIFIFIVSPDKPTTVVKKFIEYNHKKDWDAAEELWSQTSNDERWIQQTVKNLPHYINNQYYGYNIQNTKKPKSGQYEIKVLVDFTESIRISERALPLQAVAKWVVNFSSA